MGTMSKYVSDDEVIASIRKYYKPAQQYSTNFRYWLHTAKKVKDGILIRIGNRKFLVEEYTGSVIKEIR